MLRLIEAATTHPVSLDDAKLHCRVVDTDQDSVLQAIVIAAEEFVAQRTGRRLAPETHRIERSCWWSCDLAIPAAPLRTVTEVSYLDAEGDEIVVDPSSYRWRRTPAGGEIWLLDSFDLPELAEERKDAVRITLEAGYSDPAETPSSGDDPELTLPVRIRQAILLLVGHWFEHREAVVTGTIATTIELAVDALLSQLRIFR
jgi:uncharacterized phiE125 gp8 family phage protein